MGPGLADPPSRSRRSSTYPYTETPLYTQNTGANYYESQATPAQAATPATSQNVASSGSVPMYVSGGQIIANPSGGGGGGGGGGGTGTYVIQGGYMLGSSSQSYSHTTRASPATVSHPLFVLAGNVLLSPPVSSFHSHFVP